MALIENKYWSGEPLKAVIHFDETTKYEVQTSDTADMSSNWLYSASFNLSEGNNKVNPLGISTSNTVTLQIYDAQDNLSPANINSPYYGKIVNGVEIDLFISYDGVTWEPYGIWYATHWSGGFSDGWHGMVTVTAEDKLNTIGNYDLPELPAYANVQAGDLIANVFNGIGIGPNEYTIDPVINKELLYGVAVGGKVRDFINNICQLLFARVIIDRQGIIRFVPALRFYSNCNEIVLNADDTGSFQNKNNNNINYNKISVKYLLAGDIIREPNLFRDTNHTLAVGKNTINDIKFKHKVLSIEQVECLYDSANSTAIIESLHYQGYQDGISITINVSGEPINNCELRGSGIIVSTTSKNVTVNIDNSSVIGGTTFEFDTKQMMTESEAIVIANALKDYLSKISRNVIMQGSVLTPKLYVGDKVTIQDTGTLYDGVYKIVAMNIVIGENYSLDFTLIRVE